MNALLSETSIESKTKELCQTILDDPGFAAARERIESFLSDDSAKAVYQAWQEKGRELHMNGHNGVQPSDQDLEAFERLRQDVEGNAVAAAFAEAEGEMNEIFGAVTKMVQKTLTLGRMPEPEDLEESGCCGGGGGCGCH